jgi:hypothetical protein
MSQTTKLLTNSKIVQKMYKISERKANLLCDVADLCLRFRLHRFVFVRKGFRMIMFGSEENMPKGKKESKKKSKAIPVTGRGGL